MPAPAKSAYLKCLWAGSLRLYREVLTAFRFQKGATCSRQEFPRDFE
jgi:hypothetical protein